MIRAEPVEAVITTLPCSKCGEQTPAYLLDVKDDGTGNFTILECERCYGPGWLPAFVAAGRSFPVYILAE